jgi:hypothetical protein
LRSPEAILTAYIELFAAAVDRGELRHDTVADLDKAVRLLAFVRGQAESVRSTHTTISLEVMQRRHGELRAMAARTIDDAVSGVVGQRPELEHEDR